MTDQEFVEYIVKALVDHPEDVSVKRSVDDMGVLIELTVRGDDMGKVIGKDGRTAKSIRTLLRVLGAKNDERVNMKIVEPEGSEPSKRETAERDGDGPAPQADSAEEAPAEEEETPSSEESDETGETDTEESTPEPASEPSEDAAPEAEPHEEKKRDHLAGLGDSPLDSLEV